MALMPVTESMFLIAESREHPMHVGSLQLFVPPGDPHEFAQEVHDKLTTGEVHELFRKRPGRPVNVMGSLAWSREPDIDFDYHVRRTVLPSPGRIRELFQFLSLNHSTPLDRYRPMWEVHIIEGLVDGRIALYTKVHHSLVDGVSALKLTLNALSTDPDDRNGVATWDPSLFREKKARETPSTLERITGGLTLGRTIAADLMDFLPAATRIGLRAMRNEGAQLPLRAPRTMFNVPIGGARRFAAESWSIERMTKVAKARGVTLNDIVLAMCSGALRSYLIDQEALPRAPLIAMVPVSLRTPGEDKGPGNSVSVILCNLGTHESDPLARLDAITDSTAKGKSMMRELNTLESLAIGAVTVAPLLFGPVPGFVNYTPPPFNVIISNVPGTSEELYWNGAKLDGIYPASIVCDGMALNITVASNGDSLNFGLICCRRSVPHLQRMLTHLENSLEELEKTL
ncbi:wax ester/triacylglycerol synthase family O-acyltransferase [Rhodococcus sp. PAMC28707]|uniref:WS/DGAT/MGAT family O-acyltransferase n=1 Tax=unclassified Rhodococcus (in: high G+C Gram-positive bacteria) TaxID=192944 RepID=UPI00109E1C9C|nr:MULTISPECIES: wax ester/triacylglycerol synthase family O-acyltransferase [unclassified Rhodococcus (in: high G+C Gram-positive bacteria)]QCB50357.1 wax ester/triacylglycerol synthase family O-acyltransferase [Rhodococcus sp. PAMC28705]QCB57951.1 wax ester/triacylglycerol synthase family O-acyltransferase [Rhodococcus sp. PAMC28707]